MNIAQGFAVTAFIILSSLIPQLNLKVNAFEVSSSPDSGYELRYRGSGR